jgi:uncharacterized protein (TIGR00369 family)
MEKELLPVQDNVQMCFGCGQANPHGMKLRFWREGPATIGTSYTPPDYLVGWGNVMHGGFSALILDETMSWMAMAVAGVRAFVTKDMTVRYKKPTFTGRKIFAYGHLVEDDGRTIKARGEIVDESGTVLSTAECRIVRVDESVLSQSGVL